MKQNYIGGRYFVYSKIFSLAERERLKKRKNSNDWKLKVTKFILEIEQAY